MFIIIERLLLDSFYHPGTHDIEGFGLKHIGSLQPVIVTYRLPEGDQQSNGLTSSNNASANLNCNKIFSNPFLNDIPRNIEACVP